MQFRTLKIHGSKVSLIGTLKGIHHSKRYFSNSRRLKIAIFNIFQTLQIKENTD